MQRVKPKVGLNFRFAVGPRQQSIQDGLKADQQRALSKTHAN
jgi:hypothetical protein